MALVLLNELMIYYLGVLSKIGKIVLVLSTEGVPTVGLRRDLGTIFKVIFQGLFWNAIFLDIFWIIIRIICPIL